MQLFISCFRTAQQRPFEALFTAGDSPFHRSVGPLSVWPVPAAAVISGHDADLKAGSGTLMSTELQGNAQKKNDDRVSKRKGKLQLLRESRVICHSPTVINIIRCHRTDLGRVTAQSTYSGRARQE